MIMQCKETQMINHFKAGQLSALALLAEIQAESAAERLDPKTGEYVVTRIAGKTGAEWRMQATLLGLQSLTLQGK